MGSLHLAFCSSVENAKDYGTVSEYCRIPDICYLLAEVTIVDNCTQRLVTDGWLFSL